jgi:putative redox protein
MMQTIPLPVSGSSATLFLDPRPSNAPAAAVLICHGFAGSPEGGSALELSKNLFAENIACLRLKFTPHQNISRQISEIAAAVDYCHSHVSKRVILIGRSMGASACLAFAGTAGPVDGLCLIAGPYHIVDCFRRLLGDGYDKLKGGETVHVEYEHDEIILRPDFITALESQDLPLALRQAAGTPLCIIHGEADDTVSVNNALDMFAAASVPKRIHLLPGIAHSFQGVGPLFIPQIIEWLKKDVLLISNSRQTCKEASDDADLP